MKKNYYWDIGEQAPHIYLGLINPVNGAHHIMSLGQAQPWYSSFKDRYWNIPTFIVISGLAGIAVGWKIKSFLDS